MPAKKAKRPQREIIGSRVIVYEHTQSKAQIRQRDFYTQDHTLQASTYFKEEQGDPDKPKAHVAIHFIYSNP